MEWQRFLNQLNAEYKDLGVENPKVEVYDANTGKQFNIVTIYSDRDDGGLLCIDILPA